MTNFIPVFPLEVVVYPQEPVNLHIFEPKYKQLIKECIDEQRVFGIPVVIDKRVQEFGTSIQVTELVKEYETGEMDVRVKGLEIFRILELVKQVPDKLYSGAIVSYPDNTLEKQDTRIADLVLEEVKRMYELLNLEEKMPETEGKILSYRIGHYIGMELQQEYELLQLMDETQRLEYIRKYMNNMMPVLKGLEQAKAKIKMNGHFRNLSLDDLDI